MSEYVDAVCRLDAVRPHVRKVARKVQAALNSSFLNGMRKQVTPQPAVARHPKPVNPKLGTPRHCPSGQISTEPMKAGRHRLSPWGAQCKHRLIRHVH